MHQRYCMIAMLLNLVFAAAAAFAPRILPASNEFTTQSNNSRPDLFVSLPLNSSLATESPQPECLRQGQVSHQMKRINIAHCYQLLTHLVAILSASPVQWNVPDHTVPNHWKWGTCMITFDKKDRDAWDVFSDLQIMKAAASTIVKCVKAETGWLGGRVSVGPRMHFVVTVFGLGTVSQEPETS